MQDAETLDEQLDRLLAMAADGHGKWDLSDNDRAAIAAVLAEVARLRKVEAAAGAHLRELHDVHSTWAEVREKRDALRAALESR